MEKGNQANQKSLQMLKSLLKTSKKKTCSTTTTTRSYKRKSDGERIVTSSKPRERKVRVTSSISDSVENVVESDGVGNNNIYSNENLVRSRKETDILVMQCLEKLNASTKLKKRKKVPWGKREESNIGNWEEIRCKIADVLIECETLKKNCDNCQAEKAVIRCTSCVQAFCFQCDINIHMNDPFHDRISYENGFGLPLSCCESLDENFAIQTQEKIIKFSYDCCTVCSSTLKEIVPTKESCVVLNIKGRFDINKYIYVCSSCGSKYDPFNLKCILKSNYWPGTPSSISLIIDVELFRMWDLLRKRSPGIAENCFLQSLGDYSKLNNRCGYINQSTFARSFREWCFCCYEKNLCMSQNMFQCPCCEQYQHSSHVDGNCKLYRYKSSGKRREESYYNGSFVVNNTLVDNYIKKIYADGKGAYKNNQDANCGGVWTAAKNIKRKAGSLDETGLEVSSCRHGLGQKALNMFQGELYGYPLYLMKFVMLPNEVKFCFADVMCKLWKFTKRHEPDIAKTINPALSNMHAKLHSLVCQVQWSGEWTKGSARSTGEETEQIFSHLSRAGSVTKYQLPENRENYLTEIMAGWNERKILNMANDLCTRFNKNEIKTKLLLTEFENLRQKTQINTTDEVCEEWMCDIKSAAAGTNKVRKLNLSEPQRLLLSYKQLKDVTVLNNIVIAEKLLDFEIPDNLNLFKKSKNDMVAEVEFLWRKYSSKSKELEGAHLQLTTDLINPSWHDYIEKLYFEKVHWMSAIKKVADSSKRRHVMRSKLAVVSTKLKGAITKYSSSNKISEEDLSNLVATGNFPWNSITSRMSVSDSNAEDRKLFAENYVKRQRALEEHHIIKKDMQSYLSFYHIKINEFETKLNADMSDTNEHQTKHHHVNIEEDSELRKRYSFQARNPNSEALRSILLKGIYFHKKELKKGLSLFKSVLSPDIDMEEEVEQESSDELSNGDELSSGDELSNDDELSNEIDQHEEDLFSAMNVDIILSMGLEIANHYKDISFYKYTEEEMCTKWCFPPSCCQSMISNNNGSNACMIIALLSGYSFTSKRSVFSEFTSTLNILENVLPLLCGCLDIGNEIYKNNKCSGFLHIMDGSKLMPPNMAVQIIAEGDCFLRGSTSLDSSLFNNLRLTSSNQFAVIVKASKAFAVTVSPFGKYIFIDSHSSGEFGASVSIIKNFDSIEGHDKEKVYFVILEILET